MTNQPTKRPINQRNDQSTNQTTNRPTERPINQRNDQSTNQTTNQPNDQPNKRPTNQTTNQPNDQSTNQTTNQPMVYISQRSSSESKISSATQTFSALYGTQKSINVSNTSQPLVPILISIQNTPPILCLEDTF